MPELSTDEKQTAVDNALVDYYGTTTVEGQEAPEVPAPAPVVETPVVETPVVNPPVVEEPVIPPAPEFIPSSTAADTEDGFEITLATDSPLTERDLDHIFEIAEKRGLDKDETLRLVHQQETYLDKGKHLGLESGKQNVMAEAQRVLKAQEDEYLADPLFNSQAVRTANEAKIDIVLNKFGSTKLQQSFREGHLKHNVELNRMLHGIASMMEEDGIRMTGTSQQNAPVKVLTTEEEKLRAAYPEHYKN